MKEIFALIDCNNFFCSCERVFNPKLKNKPVAVLSNNDGCIVARSNEVKALGIPMGCPVYQVESIINQHNIQIFSANFPLYADFSSRVMNILSQFTPRMEIYSIDEAFLYLTHLRQENLTEYCHNIRDTVEKWTGIPISIGIAPTKTLAKAANKFAKKNSELKGVMNFFDTKDLDSYLQKLEVIDIWGIGRKLSKKLNMSGIYTAYQLKNMPDPWIKKNLNVSVLRTVLELQGTPCIKLEDHHELNKSIISSRSFGHAVDKLQDLQESVSSYTAIAAEKLRNQNATARFLTVYITTNYFKKEKQYSNALTLALPEPTNYTPDLIRTAKRALNSIYKSGFSYKKTGVVITGIEPYDGGQIGIFNCHKKTEDQVKIGNLMKFVDFLNMKWGRGTVKVAAQGLEQEWKMKCEKRSPRYTTDWSDLLKIRI